MQRRVGAGTDLRNQAGLPKIDVVDAQAQGWRIGRQGKVTVKRILELEISHERVLVESGEVPLSQRDFSAHGPEEIVVAFEQRLLSQASHPEKARWPDYA